jgi:hypothetical protein
MVRLAVGQAPRKPREIAGLPSFWPSGIERGLAARASLRDRTRLLTPSGISKRVGQFLWAEPRSQIVILSSKTFRSFWFRACD